eukprot:scaffold455661_cov20-Prasinocladus_malaysianus.AAC.1
MAQLNKPQCDEWSPPQKESRRQHKSRQENVDSYSKAGTETTTSRSDSTIVENGISSLTFETC